MQTAIIGAGPAGITAAYELSRHGLTGTIYEAEAVVGGISRTANRDGFRFDLGGHRFFSKSQEINDLWREMLSEPLLTCPRLSRIFYDDKFWDYPLKASNALRNMGIPRALACMGSYAWARMHPIPDPRSFEEWVINQFGRKLYQMFFKTYTEKVWGMPCAEIGADWAAQRIKGLSLGEAVRNALFGSRGRDVKTLIEEFQYPRLGPGQLWEDAARAVTARGWTLVTEARVTGVQVEDGRVTGLEVSSGGRSETVACAQALSSMPLRDLVAGCSSGVPAPVREAASALAYRGFLTVALVLEGGKSFPDNWVYVHSPEVRLGRIQNFRNWSPDLVPDPGLTCLGLEYFCNEGDALWSLPDEELVALGYAELTKIGLCSGALVRGFVERVGKAYPVYDAGYQERVTAIRDWSAGVEGLQCIGRNGQHRYNNMDHSMMTALIAARHIV
ncbi:MAG: NAD(P)/FAD-dependent oxidoreductase, partial [Armatimonadota bacterium]